MKDNLTTYIVTALVVVGILAVLHLGSSTMAEDFGSTTPVVRTTKPIYQIDVYGAWVVRLNTVTGEVRAKSIIYDGNITGNGKPIWLPDQN